MSISPSYVDGLELRIKELGEQVEKLKAELKSIDGALNDPRANLTLTTSEIIWELKEQLAALAEQNERMRKALTKWRYLDSSYNWRCGPCGNEVEGGHTEGCALSLTNLTTPVLNRIRADGMRMAADIADMFSDKHSMNFAGNAAGAIRARADKL